MLILTIRTDNPQAELGLFDDKKKLEYITWQAHRELSSMIHCKIKQLLEGKSLELKDLDALVVFKGPGSFTGLRIGISVANALAYSLSIKVVSETENSWIEKGIKRILSGETETIALPEYGSEPHITQQKK